MSITFGKSQISFTSNKPNIDKEQYKIEGILDNNRISYTYPTSNCNVAVLKPQLDFLTLTYNLGIINKANGSQKVTLVYTGKNAFGVPQKCRLTFRVHKFGRIETFAPNCR